MPYISQEGLKCLEGYKYNVVEYSKLDLMLNPYWEWVESVLPKSWAPNVITLIGFCFMVTSYLIMLWYDHTFTKDLPGWVYVFAGLSLFIYQTLDAVDGKRARNTNSASPLGQLFDHGCDSISTTFFILSICQTLRLGPSSNILMLAAIFHIGFFTPTWGEYHSGVFGVPNFFVTEFILITNIAYFVTGITGPGIYDFTLLKGLQAAGASIDTENLNHWISVLLTCDVKTVIARGLTFAISRKLALYAYGIYKQAQDKWLAIEQFVPVVCVLLSAYLWSSLPIFETECALVMLSWGLTISLITCKLMVCSLTETRTSSLHWGVAMLFVFYAVIRRVQSETMERVVVLTLTVYVFATVIFWTQAIMSEIANHLGIYAFRLPSSRKGKKKQ